MNNREVEIKMEIKDKAQVENIRKFLQENEGQRPQSIVMKAIYYDIDGYGIDAPINPRQLQIKRKKNSIKNIKLPIVYDKKTIVL